MKVKNIAVIFSVLCLAGTIWAQTKFNTYANARFGYSIAYPANLKPQGEAANGDGQIFTAEGATLTVFGTNQLVNQTLKKEFDATLKEIGVENVSYKVYRKNFFIFSAKENGKIIYQKVIKKADGAFITFIFEYDEAKRNIYDKAVAKIEKSFK